MEMPGSHHTAAFVRLPDTYSLAVLLGCHAGADKSSVYAEIVPPESQYAHCRVLYDRTF